MGDLVKAAMDRFAVRDNKHHRLVAPFKHPFADTAFPYDPSAVFKEQGEEKRNKDHLSRIYFGGFGRVIDQ